MEWSAYNHTDISGRHGQIITLNVGGCGVNLGKSQLQQYCIEQGIGCDGHKKHKTLYDASIPVSFEELHNGRYVARSLFVDLDPYSIEIVKKRFKYRDIIKQPYTINGKQDTGLNFAAGHYTQGKELIDSVNDRVRLLSENCDRVQAFVINHSVSGGTGSGLGALILERIAVDYRKRDKFTFDVFPHKDKVSPMEMYNCLMTSHWLLDHAEFSVIIDNTALYNICKNRLNIKGPCYSDYNKIITRLASNITAHARFGLRNDLRMMSVHHVPFPRLHFMTMSMSPLQINDDEKKDDENANNMLSLMNNCLSTDNFLIDYADFDPKKSKYMSVEFGFRGKQMYRNLNEIDESLMSMYKTKKMNFTQWTVNKASISFVEGCDSKDSILKIGNEPQVTMIGNNTRIGYWFEERIKNEIMKYYSERCYVLNYTKEGMEEGEVMEAVEDIGFQLKDYLDVSSD